MPHNFVTVPLADRCRIANARVPVDLAPELTAHANSDRIASCDILIEAGRIAALAAPGSGSTKDLPVVDLRDGIVLPRFVDVHTHIDKGHIWARAAQSGRLLLRRALSRGGRPRGELERRGRARPHGLLAALCLRARHRRAAHASRLHRPADRRSPGRCSRKCAKPGRTASRCRRWRCFRSTSRVDDEPQFRAIVETVARHGGVLGGLTFLGRSARRRSSNSRSTACSASLRRTVSISTSMSTKAPRPTRARSSASRSPRCATAFEAASSPGIAARWRSSDDRPRTHHRAGGRGGHRGRVAADVQHVSAGPQPGRTPRCAALRRCTSSTPVGVTVDGRERQHARSVLCLRRPRHAGGVSRGDAHPAFRSFGSAVAAACLAATPGEIMGLPSTAASRSARPPTWC